MYLTIKSWFKTKINRFFEILLKKRNNKMLILKSRLNLIKILNKILNNKDQCYFQITEFKNGIQGNRINLNQYFWRFINLQKNWQLIFMNAAFGNFFYFFRSWFLLIPLTTSFLSSLSFLLLFLCLASILFISNLVLSHAYLIYCFLRKFRSALSAQNLIYTRCCTPIFILLVLKIMGK